MADRLRRAVVAAGGTPLASIAVGLLDRLVPRRPGVLTVLTYHRVDEADARPDLMPSLISATPAAFAAQMRLVARSFDPVCLGDVLEALDRPDRLPRRPVLVTFDDGYRDFARHAWPVMRAASIPATMFVATAFADDPTTAFWWDRLAAAVRATGRSQSLDTPAGRLSLAADARAATVGAIRRWLKDLEHERAMDELDRIVEVLGAPPPAPSPALLGWDELRALAREGVTLAPHTRHHPLLDRVAVDTAVEEIAGSHADLERETGAIAPVPRVLAYPSGAHGGDAVQAARRAGMVAAMTTTRGGNDLARADRFRLRRINVGRMAVPPLLHAQLLHAATLGARRPA